MNTLWMCVKKHLAISATCRNDMLGHDPGAHATVLKSTRMKNNISDPEPWPT